MTLQQVFDFLAVVQHGSLHAAARASGQTQPALTRSLRRLEADLGAPLFVRHARGMQPSPAGQRFLAHARRLASEAERARDAVAQAQGLSRGRVAYGISAAPSLLLAPAAIGRFRKQFDGVALHSRSGLFHNLAPALRDGQLDFMICPPPADPDPELSGQVLMRSQMVMLARRGHPLAEARSLASLRGAEFTTAAPAGLPGGGVYTAFAQAGLGPARISLHTDGLIDTIAFVAGSDALALMPEALWRSGLLQGRLVVLPLADPLPSYDVVLFRRRDTPATPAAQALATQFEREAAYLAREQMP